MSNNVRVGIEFAARENVKRFRVYSTMYGGDTAYAENIGEAATWAHYYYRPFDTYTSMRRDGERVFISFHSTKPTENGRVVSVVLVSTQKIDPDAIPWGTK